MRELFATRQFQKDFNKISSHLSEQADILVDILRENPTNKSLNIKKLKDIRPSVWRVRLGSHRLIYSFNKKSITLHRILHRKDIYRNL